MVDNRRSTRLERLGRRLAGASVSTRLGAAFAGFVVFLGLSSLAWSVAATHAVPWIEQRLAAAPPAGDGSPAPPPASFGQRVERVTEIAKGVFLDLGFSRDHFLTRYAEPRETAAGRYEFQFWEVWTPPDFAVEQLVRRLQANHDAQAENVRLDSETIDEKTGAIKVFVDGVQTHQLLFTAAAREAPEGGRVLLANAPAEATKIDIGAIPTMKYAGAPQLAIVIDDIGFRDAVDRLFFKLPAKLTLSVLPYGPTSRETAEMARRRGHEVMLHLPMEPLDMRNHDPGPGKLLLAMNDEQIRRIVEQDLQQVPDVVGVNNHMGSAFTQNLDKTRVALEPLKSRGLFFLDSMTIGKSVAFKAAKLDGLRVAVRNIFLDYNPELEPVRRQVELAGRIARAQGQAIAIGHPFQTTFQALQEILPKLLADGVVITPVGALAK